MDALPHQHAYDAPDGGACPPLFDRGAVLVSMAVATALGATSMSDIALLAHLAPVLGGTATGSAARRALELAGPGHITPSDTW